MSVHVCEANCLHLKERDMEIIRMIGRGKTNREIANLLECAVSTVKNRLVDLNDEFGCSTRSALVMSALRSGLVSLAEL